MFSRLFLMIILMIFQLLLFLTIYSIFAEYVPNFAVIQALFTTLMVFYLFRCNMDSSAKLTWLAIISVFPLPGAILLWFTTKSIGHRAHRSRISRLIEETKNILPQDKTVLCQPELTDSGTDDLCRYMNRTGCFPIYRNTEVTYFPQGEDKFTALLEELQKAERFIFLEYFIIDEGYMWGRVLKILADKAAKGVDVRVMFDGMCEISTLSFDYPKRMAGLGIKCRAFAPIRPFISTHYNYRDHRKILVIDGETAFNGGINLADEYINRIERFGHWKDTAVMLKGDAVQSFTLMFLQMWNISERTPEWDSFLALPEKRYNSDGYVMPYGDIPLDGDKVGENVYMDILDRARSYVYIMTPYLILDGELESSLKFAAQRGIDVRIILPGIPDKKPAYALAKTHYTSLKAAGVRIFEYTPGFVHAKVCVCDDEKAVVGTINFDYRSLYHHFECATYMYRTSCISDIKADFLHVQDKCREVTPETIRNEKLYYKFVGSLMKVIAPLI
ncbi:MAG: cardiolipin synthase [Ruminococcus sp.]|nr:cardiolipin synthase [Ruminococcus sp.]